MVRAISGQRCFDVWAPAGYFLTHWWFRLSSVYFKETVNLKHTCCDTFCCCRQQACTYVFTFMSWMCDVSTDLTAEDHIQLHSELSCLQNHRKHEFSVGTGTTGYVQSHKAEIELSKEAAEYRCSYLLHRKNVKVLCSMKPTWSEDLYQLMPVTTPHLTEQSFKVSGWKFTSAKELMCCCLQSEQNTIPQLDSSRCSDLTGLCFIVWNKVQWA